MSDSGVLRPRLEKPLAAGIIAGLPQTQSCANFALIAYRRIPARTDSARLPRAAAPMSLASRAPRERSLGIPRAIRAHQPFGAWRVADDDGHLRSGIDACAHRSDPFTQVHIARVALAGEVDEAGIHARALHMPQASPDRVDDSLIALRRIIRATTLHERERAQAARMTPAKLRVLQTRTTAARAVPRPRRWPRHRP